MAACTNHSGFQLYTFSLPIKDLVITPWSAWPGLAWPVQPLHGPFFGACGLPIKKVQAPMRFCCRSNSKPASLCYANLCLGIREQPKPANKLGRRGGLTYL